MNEQTQTAVNGGSFRGTRWRNSHQGWFQSMTRTWLFLLPLVVCFTARVSGQILTHPDPGLYTLYPAGAQRGQTVSVEFLGRNGFGRGGENFRVMIDGPPGISVGKVEWVNVGLVRAEFTIAADAPLGRRCVRIAGGSNGLTNFRFFYVGALPELAEAEENNVAETAQEIAAPVVVNGRVNATLDVDWYRFAAKRGEHMVCAILAHGMDGFVDYRQGYLDTNLELRDSQGKVIATAEDTLGLDPVIDVDIPADGKYYLRVGSLGYQGSDHAVYRLTIGEVPYATAIFPPGGQRGTEVQAELFGPNVPAGTRLPLTIETADSIPTGVVSLGDLAPSGGVVPVVRGDFPERIETEPNDARQQAMPVTLPATVNGRFTSADDEDWYAFDLAAGEGVLLATMAQRNLHSPVDTELTIFDALGTAVAANDDGSAFSKSVQCAHDFAAQDSFLQFKPAAAGKYFVRVSDLNGSTGMRSLYRLSLEPLAPDFLIYQWPDAVPIWGPGTSATFVVEILKWGGLKNDVEVRVEDLPDGWQGSVANWPQTWYGHYNGNAAVKLLLSITAPADAAVGTIVPFRVVGRSEQDGRTVEREARYMTLYGSSHSDRMHVRYSRGARAVVADFLDSWIESSLTEVSGKVGETVKLPVTIHRREEGKAQIGLVVNGPTPSAGCGWGSPITLADGQSECEVPLSLEGRSPGTYGIVVARSWASDLRAGRPGPCTQMITLKVLPP